jgi:ligand-binding SRPBCC domain-containing protein
MIELTTRLPAPAAAVWARAVTPDGINDELRPILRMTMPRGMDAATIEDVAIGEELGRSWILLAGLIPVDYDDLRLVAIDREPKGGQTLFRFEECSRTAAFAVWSHERIVESEGDHACTVTDRLGWELKPIPARVPGSARLAAAIVGFLFRHRHRRLRRRWGE